MRMKRNNQAEKSDSIYENLVDKSLGSARLKLHCSSRHSNRGREGQTGGCFTNTFLADLPELLRPEVAATVIGVSVKTIYDWRYRCKQRRIPTGLFVKINRTLLIRTSVLREWIASQNPSLLGGRSWR